MAQANGVQVQASTDGSNWTNIYAVSTAVGGIFSDHFVWQPPAPGVYYLRVVATDNNGNAVGRTTITAMAANR